MSNCSGFVVPLVVQQTDNETKEIEFEHYTIQTAAPRNVDVFRNFLKYAGKGK